MEMNWILLAIVAIAAIFLVVFLIKRNLKDEKDLEVFLNENEIQIEEEEDEINNNR